MAEPREAPRFGVRDKIAVVFLAWPAAALITGTTLLIDGAFTVR